MAKNLYSHKVSLNDRRRANKKINDIKSKSISKKSITEVFNTYYRDQVRALYEAVRDAD